MYLIIKHQKYDHFNDDYTVAGTSDYLEGANELLEAHKIINKNKSITFTVVNLDGPLLLTDEVKDSKQLKFKFEGYDSQ
jgi:hypothetical protein|tara:strand:+ start:176 stop:412 length:237 start_codon:yes stop_codon:yes gene_type:complete